MQGIEQCRGRVGHEAEAIASIGIGVHIGHRIGQATGGVDDGQRAIAQGDQLAQAPWLKRAGHQKEIRASVDAVGERNVETNTRSHIAGSAARSRNNCS